METNSNLNKQQINELISAMECNACDAPMLKLTLTNWLAEFGETGMVETPIGKVKMGENQYNKLIRRSREKEFGMIKPTLLIPTLSLRCRALQGRERSPNDRAVCCL